MSAWHEASTVWTCWDSGTGCEGIRKAGWNFQGCLRLCSAQPALPIPKAGGRKSQQHQYSQQQALQAPANMEKYCFHSGKICSYIMLNIVN